MKKTKKLLLHSALALLLCISVLIGTTFAWFTDTVTSGKNIIKSGNLDLEMYWTNDPDKGWNNVEDAAYNTIFSYDNWEPGYTEVKYIKLVNKGSLALKYELAITPEAEVGKLAEVIQVYYENGEVDFAGGRADVSNMKSLGFLNNVLNGGSAITGALMAEGQAHPTNPVKETVITVAMNMITTAGNDYQNETAGDFSITAIATQEMHEQDSFGSDYDANAEFPPVLKGASVSAPVDNNNGAVASPVTLAGNGLSAYVPAGVALKDGVDTLTLSTKVKNATSTGFVPVGGEKLLPLDVHIEGIDENNTVPIIIDLGAIMPKYLNMGNYTLTHVENGVNVPMTLVDSKAALANHNDFYYNANTGEISVAMKSFSEVTLIINTENPWNGEYRTLDAIRADFANGTKFSGGEGSSTDPYIIATADDLADMNELISYDSANYGNKYYKLISDINIDGDNGNIWYPIGYHKKGVGNNGAAQAEIWYEYGGSFTGVFDGAGHIVTGIKQRTWDMDGNYDAGYWKAAMGLFGRITNGTVMNLVIDDFYSEGEFAPTGCVTARADGACTFENITVLNSHPQTYNTGVSCVVGWDACPGGDANDESKWSQFKFKNITIDDSNTVSSLWGSWDVAAAGILGALDTESTADFENCYVSATLDVYNDVCANYQYYWYRYTGAFIGTVYRNSNTSKISLEKVTATNCYADFRDERHDYFYCELVANTIASYTHEHQFSRLTRVKAVDVANKTITTLEGKTEPIPTSGRRNYVVANAPFSSETATCYHFVDGEVWNHEDAGKETINGVEIWKEDNRHIYLPYRQLFGGYGWGTDGFDLGELGVDKSIVQIEDVTTVEEKFRPVASPFAKFENGTDYNLSELFTVMKPEKVVKGNLKITVSPASGDCTVKETIGDIKNCADLDLLNISFTGTGTVQIIINDYNMCKPVSVMIKVVEKGTLDGDDDGGFDVGDFDFSGWLG